MLDMNIAARIFKQRIYSAFNTWATDRPPRLGYPHASELMASPASFCLRKLVLAALHPEAADPSEPLPGDYKRNAIFLNGWQLHEKYQKLLSSYGGALEIEQTHFDHDRMIAFTPDAIIEHCGEQMAVEIKGYNSLTCSRLREDRQPPRAARLQLNFYLWLLGLEHGLILIENKDNQEILCWGITVDPLLIRSYQLRMTQFVEEFVACRTQERALPDRLCPDSSTLLARKCAMCQKCFNL